ncbi:MAG TPA: BNR-4 repeat-containing protein [Verrucomicrobiae bacterium]
MICRLILFLCAAAGISAQAALAPYSVDSTTLHLWHFDESAPPFVDSAPGGTNLTYILGGATPGVASYSTNLLVPTSFTNCINFGTLATTTAVIYPIGSGNTGTPVPLIYAGTNGAFTFEAIIKVQWNPTNNYSVNPDRNQPFQIMNCDADGSGSRVFQLRIDPVGFAAGGRNTGVCGIEFINGTTTVAAPPIPTNGPDAIVSNGWYHIAVTYSGNANTTSNLLFYWTLVDPSRTSADCIFGADMAGNLSPLSGANTILSIGNSARNPGGGSGPDSANFVGDIDEVRISSVARPANGMLFTTTNVAILSQPAPASQAVGPGQPFSIIVVAGGEPPLDYQWWQNGNPIAGATNSIFAVGSAESTNFGNYTVVVANDFGSVTSTVASVTVTNIVITSQPANCSAAYGSTATFNVTATGAQPMTFQWWQNGSPILGATNSTLTLTPLVAANAGTYYAVVANSFGAITSTVATLTFDGPPVTLTQVNNGNVAASGYAYAGSSDINGTAFICSGLMTVSNQQFFVYYGWDQTNPSYPYNGTIWIARRTIESNDWQVVQTTFTPDDITDGHDVVAFGIDGANYLHMSWGMHDQSLHYARSTAPVVGSTPISMGSDLGSKGMTGVEVSVTYPQFLTMPNGDLLFLYRVGESGGGNTWLNRWSVAAQTWTNVDTIGGSPSPFIQGLWPGTNYNAYPNMPCVDANGNLYLGWTWRETPAYESNNNLLLAKSTNGGVSWETFNGIPYDLPISQGLESGDPASVGQVIVPIPPNYSLINQAGMCLDASNNPVLATWWAPGSLTGNYRRQYMIVFPDSNGVWQTRQISNRTNDPPGTMELDGVVRDLGRPVVVCDKENRVIVLYRDDFGSNGLTAAYTLPYAMDPQRTNWTTINLTTDNLGDYEPVIDLARWQRDNVMDIVYQASDGEGYTAPTNNASLIGVLEWNTAAYFDHVSTLELSAANSSQTLALSWNSQPGWGYQVQWSTNLFNWNTAATFNDNSAFVSQYFYTNSADAPEEFWRLVTRQGGF